MTNGKLHLRALRLAELSSLRKSIEKEEAEIRKELAERMEPGSYIKVLYAGTKYRLMHEKNEKRVLVPNEVIAKAVGKVAFLRLVSLSIEKLTGVVGKEEIGKYIDRIETSYRPVLREEKEGVE